MDGEFDYAHLIDSLLVRQPVSPAVQAALAQHPSAADAWRSLTGADTTGRYFLHATPCDRCEGVGAREQPTWDWNDHCEMEWWTCGTCRGTGDDPSSSVEPEPEWEHVLALGDSIEAMHRSEHWAREVVAALEPWGLGAVDRVVWRVGNTAHDRHGAHVSGISYEVESQFSSIFRHHETHLATLDRAVSDAVRFRFYEHPHADRTGEMRKHAMWCAAAELGLRVPEGENRAGASFADLVNPYTPLLRIWQAGFGLDRLEDGAIVLYAPPRSSPTAARRSATVQRRPAVSRTPGRPRLLDALVRRLRGSR